METGEDLDKRNVKDLVDSAALIRKHLDIIEDTLTDRAS